FWLALVVVAGGCSSDGSDGPRAGSTTTTVEDTRTSTTTAVDEPVSLGEPIDDQTAPTGTNGLAFDADGRLWIADLAGGQLLAVDPADGAILARLGAAQGVRTPDDLVFDAEGRLWWTENGAGNVGRIDDPLAAGAVSETVAELGPGANPIAIADD